MAKPRIPILDLQAQDHAIGAEVRVALARVLEGQQFILGPEVEAFEREIAAYLGVRHAIGVNSGSDALVLALRAAGIGPGHCVLTTPFTYVATAEAIDRVGARPVFVDVAADLNLAPEALEETLERHRDPRVKAILPVHLFGRPCDIGRIREIAQRSGLALVEDAAQAIGARFDGRIVGTVGDAGCFSFFPSKNLGGCGDGGLIVTPRDDLAALLRQLRVHGAGGRRYVHERLGHNSRLDAIQAAVLRVKLPHLGAWNEARRAHARAYTEAFAGSAVRTPPLDGAGRFDIFHAYVIRVPARDELVHHLSEKGIQTAVHYPVPLHLQPCFAELGYRKGDLPEAERASDEVLSLPIYPELPEAHRAEVAGEIRRFLEERA